MVNGQAPGRIGPPGADHSAFTIHPRGFPVIACSSWLVPAERSLIRTLDDHSGCGKQEWPTAVDPDSCNDIDGDARTPLRSIAKDRFRDVVRIRAAHFPHTLCPDEGA